MSDSIRDMISKANLWKTSCSMHVGGVKFRAWPNGHLRVDGVHTSIARAQTKLDSLRVPK